MKALKTILVAGTLAACGDEGPPAPTQLDLAPNYLGTGVVRVSRELQPLTPLRAFRFRLQNVTLSGGQVSAEVQREAARAFTLSGRYDVVANQVRFDPNTRATLTSSATEQTVTFGFRPEDGLPSDGVASELVGFVSTATIGTTTSGRWVGVEDVADQVPTPDASLISVTPSNRVGRVILEGQAGSTMGGAGVQVFRFSPELETPDVQSVPVRFSGAFALELPAVPGDIILIRGQVARRNGDAAIIPVP